jgi:hypothetical protein
MRLLPSSQPDPIAHCRGMASAMESLDRFSVNQSCALNDVSARHSRDHQAGSAASRTIVGRIRRRVTSARRMPSEQRLRHQAIVQQKTPAGRYLTEILSLC